MWGGGGGGVTRSERRRFIRKERGVCTEVVFNERPLVLPQKRLKWGIKKE